MPLTKKQQEIVDRIEKLPLTREQKELEMKRYGIGYAPEKPFKYESAPMKRRPSYPPGQLLGGDRRASQEYIERNRDLIDRIARTINTIPLTREQLGRIIEIINE